MDPTTQVGKTTVGVEKPCTKCKLVEARPVQQT